MRVKMAMETEDSSRMTWFQDTVSSATMPDNGPWRGSPWRMLQELNRQIPLMDEIDDKFEFWREVGGFLE